MAALVLIVWLFLSSSAALPLSSTVLPFDEHSIQTNTPALGELRSSDALSRKTWVETEHTAPSTPPTPTYLAVFTTNRFNILSSTTLTFKAAAAKPSSSTSEPDLLSAPILAAIASGTVVLLSGTSMILYWCTRRSKKKKKKMPKKITQVLSPLTTLDKRRQSTSPALVFDFSPPSPHWTPAPPSIAHVIQKKVGNDRKLVAPHIGYTATDRNRALEPTFGVPPQIRTAHQRPARFNPPVIPPLPPNLRIPISGNVTFESSPRVQVKEFMMPSNAKDRRSGLGISTIDLGPRNVVLSQEFGPRINPNKTHTLLNMERTESSRISNRTDVSEPVRKPSTSRSRAGSSVYLAYNDVKLAYTVSVSSITSDKNERINRMKQRRDANVDSMDEEVKIREGQRLSVTDYCIPPQDVSNSLCDAKLQMESHTTVIGRSRSKRLGLLDAVDESHKSELQAMASLGSDSFDSLLAYLTETDVEPTIAQSSQGDVSASCLMKESTHNRTFLASENSTASLITRNDTQQINHFAFEAWLASAPNGTADLARKDRTVRQPEYCNPISVVHSSRKDMHGNRHGLGFHHAETPVPEADSTAETTLIEEYCMEIEDKVRFNNTQASTTLLETMILNQGKPGNRNTANMNDSKTGVSEIEKIIDVGDINSVEHQVQVAHQHDAAVTNIDERDIQRQVVRLPDTTTTNDKRLAYKSGNITTDYYGRSDLPTSYSQRQLPELVVPCSTPLVLPLCIKPKLRSTPETQASSFPQSSIKDKSRLPSFSFPSSATKLFSSLSSETDLNVDATSARVQSFLTNRLLLGASSTTISQTFSGAGLEQEHFHDPFLTRLSTTSTPPTPPSRPLSINSASSTETFAFQDWCRESLTPRFNHVRAVLEGHRLEDPPAMPPADHPEIQAAMHKFVVQSASSAVTGKELERPTMRNSEGGAGHSRKPVHYSPHQTDKSRSPLFYKHRLTELHMADVSAQTPSIVLEDVSEIYSSDRTHAQGHERIKHCSSGEWLSDKRTRKNML